MNILIIEDEQELADSMVRYLQENTYHCEIALNFTQAMEKINLFVTISGKQPLHLSGSIGQFTCPNPIPDVSILMSFLSYDIGF